jgi:hypothetical protein
MATQFKVWIDSPDDATSGNVMSQSDFAIDSQRISGYAFGQTVSSKRLNTILRQTSLIMVALMDQFCPSSTATLMSSLATVKTALGNAIATKSSVTALSATVTAQGNHLDTLQNTVNNIIGASSETIPAVAARVTNIENGTTIVPNAISAQNAAKATNDVNGNAIKSNYGSSLDVSDATITLKAKDGTQLSSKTINNVANASQATTLGASNIGTSKKFIYLVGGVPFATSETIGSTSKPIYMRNGELNALTGDVGNSNTPVYMNAGSITSTGKDLRKMMNDLNVNIANYMIFNFVAGNTYTWTQIQGDAFYNAINSIFANYPDGVYPVSLYKKESSALEKEYYTGILSKTTSVDPEYFNYTRRHYSLCIRSALSLNEFQINAIARLENTYKSVSCIRIFWNFDTMSSSIGSHTSSAINTISVSSTQSGVGKGKSMQWEQYI